MSYTSTALCLKNNKLGQKKKGEGAQGVYKTYFWLNHDLNQRYSSRKAIIG